MPAARRFPPPWVIDEHPEIKPAHQGQGAAHGYDTVAVPSQMVLVDRKLPQLLATEAKVSPAGRRFRRSNLPQCFRLMAELEGLAAATVRGN